MKRVVQLGSAAALAVAFAATIVAAATEPMASESAANRGAAPSRERLAEMARDLAKRLDGRSVKLPDGDEAPLVSSVAGARAALLTPERITRCLETIGDAQAWPAAWLVVQDASATHDLVLRIRLDPVGRIEDPDPVFAATRRDWDSDSLESAVRAATGRKPPRERERNLVIQEFSKKTEVLYVYETPVAGSGAKGLAAFLPEGSLIREARTVDLGDGKRHTLALVLRNARFEPSPCESPAAIARGHSDTGRVLLVLAGETKIEDQRELDPFYEAAGVTPWLPRFACRPGDDRATFAGDRIGERASRPPVELLILEDRDGDGLKREISLPVTKDGSAPARRLVVGIASSPPRITLQPAE